MPPPVPAAARPPPVALPALASAALVVMVLAQAGDVPAPGQSSTTLFLPASGVALALLLCTGPALLPGIGAGWLLAYALAGEDPLHALSHTLGNVTALWVAWRWLRRHALLHPDLPRFDTFKHLLLGACAMGAGAGALVSSAGHWLAQGRHAGDSGVHLLAQAWMGQALGFLLATPLALCYRRALLRPEPLTRLREGLLVWLLACASASAIFGRPPAPQLAPLANAYWMFLFVGWSGMRLGMLATMALLNLIALMALWGVYQGSGFFGNDIAATDGFGYWSYAMILGVMGLALATYLTDQQAQQERQRSAERAQRNALVREVHHRIKNNLQGIVGMLRQLDRRHPQLHQAINQMVTQVHGVAVVHGLQGRSAGEAILLAELTHAIAQGVAQHWGTAIREDPPAPQSQPWRVAASEAVPLALVLGELMVNAVKHGGQARQDVHLQWDDSAVGGPAASIVLSNPGTWDTADATAPLPAGHGLNLVRLLLPRNGARLSHHQRDGRIWARLDLGPPVIHRDN